MQPKQYPISSWMTLKKWDVDLAARVREWSEIGFNLIMTPRVTADPETHEKAKALLDLCAAADIEAIVMDDRAISPSGNWGNPAEVRTLPADYRERAAAAVAEFAGHPAVWGIYVTDEPLEGNLPAVTEACKIIRDLTDQAEPYVNLLPNHFLCEDGTAAGIERHIGFTDFAAYLDHVVRESAATMLSYDQYCSMSAEWGGPDKWYRCLADYQGAAIRNGVPFWNIILAHGHWMYKAPTPLEMSWQFYCSLAYGAQGIMYFMYRAGGLDGYGAPIDELGNRGPLFAQLQRQHAQFLGEWAWRFGKCKPVATYHWPNAPVGLKLLDGSGVVASVTEEPSTLRRPSPPSHLVIGEFRDEKNRPHVLVANGSTAKHTFARITCRGKAIHSIVSDGVERRTGKTSDDGTVSIANHIMPGVGMFFRVEQ